MKLYPWKDVTVNAEKIVLAGHTIHQQFLCAKCGAKQTMAQANTFFTSGICEECGHETNIRENGTNFMMIKKLTDKASGL
jgi:hypothetical protein